MRQSVESTNLHQTRTVQKQSCLDAARAWAVADASDAHALELADNAQTVALQDAIPRDART